jgi:hypothetical protein
MPRQVRQVVKQTRARLLERIAHFPGKTVNLFEPHTDRVGAFCISRLNQQLTLGTGSRYPPSRKSRPYYSSPRPTISSSVDQDGVASC